MSREVALAFGRVLLAARKAAGLSQEKLAELAELDRTTPSLYERGLRQPTLTVLLDLAGALHVTPETLLTATLAQLGTPNAQPEVDRALLQALSYREDRKRAEQTLMNLWGQENDAIERLRELVREKEPDGRS